MLIIKIAWRNLTRHIRKTILLAVLIVIGITVLFISKSIFDGTTDGLKRSFIGSFTGDTVIGEKSDTAFSLFGNEVPIVSSYESIPPLISHSEIIKQFADLSEIAAYTSIVSSPAKIGIGDFSENIPLFGIDPKSYFDVCVDVKIKKGDVSFLSERGVFLNSALASKAEAALNRPLEIGEPVSFSMYVGNSFKLRTVPFAGIHEYVGSNEALDRVVLADLVTVRSLANYTLGFKNATIEENGAEEADSFDMDALFSDNLDIVTDNENKFDLSNIEAALSDTTERDQLVLTDEGAWSFILIRAKDGSAPQMIKKLQKRLDHFGIDADLLSWRRAAGSTALTLFAVQTLFYAGLGFLGLGAIFVIMNALVISVLERTNEIGTMRSLGASSGFISRLFIAESLIITLGGAIIGIILGVIITVAINKAAVVIENPLLISLFGGNILSPKITAAGIFLNAVIGLLLGSLAWIYPVSLAMKVQPIAAINKV